MPKFLTGQRLPGNIAFVRIEDDGTMSIMRKNGGGMSLNPRERAAFMTDQMIEQLTEVTEEEAIKLFRADKPPERIIEATVLETRTGTVQLTAGISDDTIETLVDVIDSAVQRGEFTQKADIRRAIRRVLRLDPTPTPDPSPTP